MFEHRIKQIRSKLSKEKLDAVLISSVSNIAYLSGYSNFSILEREAYIFIGKNFEYIITDGRYSEAVKKEVPHLILFERGNGKSTEDLFKKHKLKSLGFEEYNITVSEHKILKKHFKTLKHFDVSSDRSIKTKEEIEKIEKACKLGDQAYQYILGQIKKGITEKQLAFEIEMFVKKNAGELSFPTIVAFGENSSVPHHQTGKDKLQKNQFVLIDMGSKLEDYCSDMTRTIIFGEPSFKQKEMYEIVLEAQRRAADSAKVGMKAGDLDRVARDYIVSCGYQSIPHSLGHGIGLEVHEHPYISSKSNEILKEGMVFSIEPGIYIKGFGGIRIEDLFVLEKGKLRQLTHSNSKLIEI